MDDKKQIITEAAIEVFQEKGIEKTTVADIVKRAGIAQGTFYLYFPAKTSVMPEIAKIMVEKTVHAFEEQLDLTEQFKDQLKKMIEIIFQYTDKYRDLYALIYVGMGSTRQFHEWETIYEPYYEFFERLFAVAQTNGEIRESLHPKRTAILIIGLVELAAEQSYLFDEQNDEAVEQKKDEVFDFALHALLPQK